MNQIEALRKIAKKNRKIIVLPEGDEPRVVEAAGCIASLGLAEVILLAKKDELEKIRSKPPLALDKIQIINPDEYPRNDELVDTFYNLRKEKGVTLSDAKGAVSGNRVYFGALLVRLGVADGFVAGANHTTSNVARAALYCIGLREDIGIMSSSFLVELQNSPYGDKGLFIFADCGIVPDPDAEELADIAISASRLYEEFFSRKPSVALLSYSTKGSARGESVDNILKALDIVRKKSPGLAIDGELQGDAAIVPEVGAIKAPGSRVAGHANVLIFPDLDSGNIAYKLIQRLGNARVVGPLIQGIKKPASDLSRGCGVEEIVDAVVATAIRAQQC